MLSFSHTSSWVYDWWLQDTNICCLMHSWSSMECHVVLRYKVSLHSFFLKAANLFSLVHGLILLKELPICPRRFITKFLNYRGDERKNTKSSLILKQCGSWYSSTLPSIEVGGEKFSRVGLSLQLWYYLVRRNRLKYERDPILHYGIIANQLFLLLLSSFFSFRCLGRARIWTWLHVDMWNTYIYFFYNKPC